MNSLTREEKMAFIFETGRAFRFHMDRFALNQTSPVDPVCSDLTPIQIKTALHVWQLQPVNLNELAQALNVTPPAASAVVDKLVEKEVLTRETDPADRRRIILRVHPRAEEDMNAVNEQFLKAFRSVADALPDESLEHWHLAMKAISTVLNSKVHS